MDGKSGAEIVARIVKKQGARYVFFGVCGGHISPLGLAFMREGIEVISTRVEPTAGFAGDAMARLTGAPAVAVGTAGPGVTNLVTPIVNAYLAQSPLVVLGGATGTLLRGKGSLQDIDQLSVLKSYTKFCARAGSVSEIPALLKTAFEAAMSDAPGPVFLELPSDVIYPAAIVEKEYGSFIGVEPREISIRRILGHLKAGKFGQAGREMYIRRHIKHVLREPQSEELPVLPHRKKISLDEVAGVGKLLSRARRPVLILGSQINWSSYKRRLLEFLEKLGLPVYLIGMARGGLGRNHPLLFALSRKKALKIADLVIVAGVSFDFRLNYGNAISGRAEVVRVDLNKDDLHKNRRARIGICGDSGEFLMRLSEIFQENQSWSDWLFHLRRLEEEAFEEKDLAFQSFSDEVPINPVRLCREVEDTLGEKSIIIGDGGDIVGTASYIVKPRFLGGWLDAGPYGTLGAGAGFALAAKLAYPDYDVGVIWGDSALSYSIIEYSTFAKRGIGILGVVGNNGVNAQIQRNDLKILGETVATDLPYDRYDLAVQVFGNSLGIWVTDPSELKVSLERGLAASRAGRPVLINVEIGTSDFRKDSLAM